VRDMARRNPLECQCTPIQAFQSCIPLPAKAVLLGISVGQLNDKETGFEMTLVIVVMSSGPLF
jgi:hypothetical protein